MGTCVIAALTDTELAAYRAKQTTWYRANKDPNLQAHALPNWPRLAPPKYTDPAAPRTVEAIAAELGKGIAANVNADPRYADKCRTIPGKALGDHWQVAATDGSILVAVPKTPAVGAPFSLGPKTWTRDQVTLPIGAWRDYAPVRAAAMAERTRARPIQWRIERDRIGWSWTAPLGNGRGASEQDTARSWHPIPAQGACLDGGGLDDRYLWPLRGQTWRVIVGGRTDPWVFVAGGVGDAREPGTLAIVVMPFRN